MTFAVRTIASVYLMVFTSNRHVRQTFFTAYVAYSLSSICNILIWLTFFSNLSVQISVIIFFVHILYTLLNIAEKYLGSTDCAEIHKENECVCQST